MLVPIGRQRVSSETGCAIRCRRETDCQAAVFDAAVCTLLDYNPCPEITAGHVAKMTKAGMTEECSSKD